MPRKLSAKPAKPAKPANVTAIAPGVVTDTAAAAVHAAHALAGRDDVTAAPAIQLATSDGATLPARVLSNIKRTATTVAANRTNFGQLSARDEAYFSFYAKLARRTGGTVTLRDINIHADIALAYTGSAKRHDAGAINRLRKAGILNPDGDGASFTFTDAAKQHKLYNA